jgi:hypothetical protein
VPARLMADALRAWREGERTLNSIPPLTPDHETVRLAIVELRATYQRVSALNIVSEDVLAANRAAIDEAMRAIREVNLHVRRPVGEEG